MAKTLVALSSASFLLACVVVARVVMEPLVEVEGDTTVVEGGLAFTLVTAAVVVTVGDVTRMLLASVVTVWFIA